MCNEQRSPSDVGRRQPFQFVSSIQMLISFVTKISMTSMPSVGSLSGTQLSTENACKIGEVGRAMGLVGREGTGDAPRTKQGVEFRARSRRLTFENIA